MSEMEQKVLKEFIKDDVSDLFHAMVYGTEPGERHQHAIKFMLAFKKFLMGEDTYDKENGGG